MHAKFEKNFIPIVDAKYVAIQVPGKIKIKMAANAPKICITTPMFGINTARASVRINHIMVTDTRRLNSVCSILSGLILKMSVQRQSRAALKKKQTQSFIIKDQSIISLNL